VLDNNGRIRDYQQLTLKEYKMKKTILAATISALAFSANATDTGMLKGALVTNPAGVQTMAKAINANGYAATVNNPSDITAYLEAGGKNG